MAFISKVRFQYHLWKQTRTRRNVRDTRYARIVEVRMYKKSKFQLSTLSAAVASTIISGYVSAQSSMLEEVVVTATRRSQSLQEIPFNITSSERQNHRA